MPGVRYVGRSIPVTIGDKALTALLEVRMCFLGSGGLSRAFGRGLVDTLTYEVAGVWGRIHTRRGVWLVWRG